MFNNILPLKQETKEKVLQAAKQLHYYPNTLAQNLATSKSHTIGVIVPYLPKVRHLLSTYYFSEIISGIGDQLASANYGLQLIFQPQDQFRNYTQFFSSKKIDGCIILGSHDVDGEKFAIEELHRLDLPYCLINQTFQTSHFHYIDAKHQEGSYQAVSHLLEQGFERIIFLNGPKTYSNSLDRLVGYQDALHSRDLKMNEHSLFYGNYSRKSGVEKAKEIAPIIKEFDAIFAANDRMAVGLIQGLYDQGIYVGKDYAIVGYDDSDIASIIHPTLTSVRVPFFKMGELAAEHVLNKVNSKVTETMQLKLPVELIVRASSNNQIERSFK